MVKKILCLILVAVAGLQAASALARDEAAEAKAQLQRELALIERIRPHVERLDLARLLLLKKNVLAVDREINLHGMSHMKTIGQYQELIVTFRYSVAFFRQIETPFTRDSIAELLRINDDIVKARGFDDSPYTQVTAHVFTHMHTLLFELTRGPLLEPALRKKVETLVVPIGHLIALAKQGDRPKTFEAAVPIYRRIEGLYPDFNAVTRASAAFDIVLEIQGLNEFYGEFAQIDPKSLDPK